MKTQEFKAMQKSLLEYTDMTRRLDGLRDEIEEIKLRKEAMREVQSVRLDGMPRGGGITDATYMKAQKIIDRFDEEMDELTDEIETVEAGQAKLGELLRLLTPDEYRVIEARYLNGVRWEYVANKLFMSRRTCFRLHDRAILKMVNS